MAQKEKRNTKSKITNQQIIDALNKNGGYVTLTAKSLHCSHALISQRISKSKVLQKAREKATSNIIDLAECVLYTAMNQSNIDMKSAVKAAEFVLKSKGQKLGYYRNGPPEQESNNKVIKMIIGVKSEPKKTENE